MTTAIYVAVCIISLLLFWWMIRLIWGKPWSINHFYTRVFLELVFDNPEILTMIGMLERFGIHKHNRKLNDASDEHQDKLIRKAKRNLGILRSYPRQKQSKAQLLSTDILDWFIDDLIRQEKFRHHDYPLNQMFGIQSQLPDLMMNLHPLKTKRDAKNYIKRLEKFGVKFEQVLEGLYIREKKGCVPPNFTINHVINEMRAFIEQAATDNPLYTVFKDKLSTIKLSKSESETLLRLVEKEIIKTVYPAYQVLIDYFSELELKTNENNGVWNLPDGDEFYSISLRSSTSTDLSPSKVHEIGIQEVNRIETQMASIFKRLGVKSSSPTKELLALGKDKKFLYPNTDEGREKCLLDYKEILIEINNVIDPVFDLRPTAKVEVKRIPEFKEKTSPGAYYMPADIGGQRPGVFYANLRDMNEIPKFGMKTLAYHEAIPGHHFQIAIAQDLKSLPLFRRMVPFTAYTEGWAMYAENLAHELGLYKDDPYGELGFLDSILFRAVRLVVDTGIHYKHWTREQAIGFMKEHTGQPIESVVTEVERYFVMPGQACSYKIGELKILELKIKVLKELGDKFNLRDFHNAVLSNGAMPLTILEEIVNDYIHDTNLE